MQGPLALFALVGVSLLAGALGHALFRRYRVSDVLLLLATGALLGPLLGILDAGLLAPALPFLAPLGLCLVLFEGGLQLGFDDLRRHAPRALAMTVATWCATSAAVAGVAHVFVGMPWVLALLLGMTVAATGIFVVIPLLGLLRAPAGARVALTLESAVGDLMSAVAVTALASILVLGATPQEGALSLAAQLGFGAATGLVGAVAWGRVLHAFGAREHAFALTLAALVVTYAWTEAIGGSGLLAALVFGLFLGNAGALARSLGLRALATPGPGARFQQGEVVFILRSIYLVYVGLAMSPAVFTWSGALLAVAFTAAMLVARVAGVLLTSSRDDPNARAERLLLVGMMPRGLAAVIVATIPASLGVPGSERFLEYAFLVLVGCDIATSAMLYVYQRRGRARPSPAAGAVVAHAP